MVASVGNFVLPSVRTGVTLCALTTAATALFVKLMQIEFSYANLPAKVIIVTGAAFASAKIMGIALPIFMTLVGVAALGWIGCTALNNFRYNQRSVQILDERIRDIATTENFTIWELRYPGYVGGIVKIYKIDKDLVLFDEHGKALDRKTFTIVSKSSYLINRVKRLLPKDECTVADSDTMESLLKNQVTYAISSTKDSTSQASLRAFNAVLSKRRFPLEASVHFETVDYKISVSSQKVYSSSPQLPENLLKIFKIIFWKNSGPPSWDE